MPSVILLGSDCSTSTTHTVCDPAPSSTQPAACQEPLQVLHCASSWPQTSDHPCRCAHAGCFHTCVLATHICLRTYVPAAVDIHKPVLLLLYHAESPQTHHLLSWKQPRPRAVACHSLQLVSAASCTLATLTAPPCTSTTGTAPASSVDRWMLSVRAALEETKTCNPCSHGAYMSVSTCSTRASCWYLATLCAHVTRQLMHMHGQDASFPQSSACKS